MQPLKRKVDVVRYVLMNSDSISHIYETRYHLTLDHFTTQNVNDYGPHGMGRAADEILKNGLAEGIISLNRNDRFYLDG